MGGKEMTAESKEDIKKKIEKEGLVCECKEIVYKVGSGPIENQPNYNKFSESLECPKCRKQFDL